MITKEGWADNESLHDQVDKLARYILTSCPGWPKDGGAIETAIQIIESQKALLLEARREGAKSAAKYVTENMWRTDVLQAPPEHRLTLQDLYEAARTAGEDITKL